MKSLLETNPYLMNKEHRESSNARSARTSCGVEGIKVKSFYTGRYQIDPSKTQKVLDKIKTRLNQD